MDNLLRRMASQLESNHGLAELSKALIRAGGPLLWSWPPAERLTRFVRGVDEPAHLFALPS